MINKPNVQRMIDFLESAPAIDMSSHHDCAAHRIAYKLFNGQYYEVEGCFNRAEGVIVAHTGIPSNELAPIFLRVTTRRMANLIGSDWVYPVECAEYVTNQMVADQLRKYL